MSRRSAKSCVQPGSIPNGRENTAKRHGRYWKKPSANCRNGKISRRDRGIAMAHAEATQAATGGVTPPRRRSLAAMLEAWLGMLVEIPAACLVVAEIVILFAGVVARYGLQQPLIWSDELASILFLWLPVLGAPVVFRRSEPMGMTAVLASPTPALGAYLDILATCAALGFLLLIG